MAARKSIPTDLLSVYDVMYMFGIGIASVYRLRDTQSLPFIQIPGSARTPAVRYSMKELVQWAKSTDREIVNMPEHKDGVIIYERDVEFRKFFGRGKI